MANNQSVRRHLDAFIRGRIIGKLEEGRSGTSVAAEFELLTASFHDFGDNFKLHEQLSGGSVVVVHEEPHPQMTGTLSYRPEETGGRQRKKSLDTRHRRLDDRYRVLPWPKDCTVVVCLHDALYGVPLTNAHRRRHSLWCREHRNWRDNEWGRVLFTDESRFSLSSDSHRILIWRERGSRDHPSNIIKRTGSVNGTRYRNEILLPYVRLFRGAMGLQFLFMDDNAPCHRTVAAEQLLESRRLAARTLPPVTIRELRLALQDEWATMPQQLIDTLILSIGRRCETCLAVREIISPTKDRMFLAGHPSQGCFGLQSHCAPCYFFSQASFYPSDFSFLVSVAYITHVLTYWGSYGIKCVDLESFCTKLY
ncbi:transposable element Tcb2 transposase [Trichonephila clavipes]|nr:transposable element Tcb2 transposase [Trichonephila clavipes]